MHSESHHRDETICRLLDADPELGSDLSADEFALARRVLVAAVALTRKSSAPDDSITERLHAAPFGLLMLDGYLLTTVRCAGRHASEIHGPGDLLHPGTEAVLCPLTTTERRALQPARLAILDDELGQAIARWPSMARKLQQRATYSAGRLAILRVVLFQPRIEIRLALILNHLAQRWGRVTADGIRIPIPLTHDLLSQLAGAARPTVTEALTRLVHDGVIEREERTWKILITTDELATYISYRTSPHPATRR